jgi:ATP-dependent 26S proteasome regulatory subunit
MLCAMVLQSVNTQVYTLQTVEGRHSILRALSRKFALGDDVKLQEIAQALPHTVTGADLGSLTSQAFSRALSRQLCKVCVAHR